MNIKELDDLINRLKNVEESINGDNSDTSFVNEIDEIMSFLKPKNQSTFTLNVSVKKLHPNAVIPSYSKDGDAGMDLTATEIINESNCDITYGTGLAMEIPKGYVGLIFPRSSIRKYELQLSNSVGVIDSGYRGEIQATFKKSLRDVIGIRMYEIGDRIAQIIILPYPQIKFNEVKELSDTERGSGGFGSTGS